MVSMLQPEDWNGLYRYCYSLTKQSDQAYDLLHTAVEKYLAMPARRAQDVKAYLRRIARNQYIDQYRRQQAFREEDIADHATLDLSTAPLEQILINQQELETIWKSLTDTESELVYLWAVEGMTAQAIADELSQPRGTVLSRIHRLRKKLTLLLQPVVEKEA